MNPRWVAPLALWVLFTAYTIYVATVGGPVGFLTLPASHPWGLQVGLDLVISLAVALVYVSPEAKRHGVARLPFVLATCVLGSVGLLANVTRVEWARARADA